MATYRCPFCKKNYLIKDALLTHMSDKHYEDLCGLSAKQIYFNFTNKYALTKGYGKSVVSGKPTPFNEITGRYLRFLPDEKDKYREYFLKNMKAAGKENIMKDMNHQKDMLAARKISGKYKWTTGEEFTYTGTYEKKFLEYLDIFLGFPAADICAPAPQVFEYTDFDGNLRKHIPDFYITSLNLIVNVKSAANKFYRLRDIETERAQDAAIKKTNYNYIKVYDNQFEDFSNSIETIRSNMDEGNGKRIIIESLENNETNLLESLLM